MYLFFVLVMIFGGRMGFKDEIENKWRREKFIFFKNEVVFCVEVVLCLLLFV